MIRTAVILAAGRGSRLDPGLPDEEQAYSKPLLRLGEQTLLERTVRGCLRVGIERIVVVTGFRAERVAQDLARYGGQAVERVHNPDWQRQNGLSLYACRGRVAEPFILSMADHLLDPTIIADLVQLDPRPKTVTLAVDSKVDRVFDLDDATKIWVEEGRIQAIDKALQRFNAIDCGLFACTPAVFDALGAAMVDNDCSLSDGMRLLAGRGDLLPFDIGPRWWQDVDTPEMLAEAQALLQRLEH